MSDNNDKVPDETKSMADTLAEMGLSRDSTYLYSHLPTVSPLTFLTDGTKAYYWGSEDDGTQVKAVVEDENRFAFTFWFEPSGLRGACQGPYYRTTWATSPDGVADHQPRTKQYPSAKGPFPGGLFSMWSARRLKLGTSTMDDQEQVIDAQAIHMTEDTMDQLSVEKQQTILSLLTMVHQMFTETLAETQAETDRLGGQGSGITHQQPLNGDVSGTETEPHVPGEWPEAEEGGSIAGSFLSSFII